MRGRSLPAVALAIALCGSSCAPPGAGVTPAPSRRTAPAPASDWATPAAIDSVLGTMTLEEKVSQMVMVRAFGHYISTDSDIFDRLAREVTERKVGGIIMAQGDVYSEAILLNRLQGLARIPLLAAADFERGTAMRVRRGTRFPEAMALGATRNAEYAYQMGR
ncbi:MAG TPA: glycoside hydrolase family 3 N-terminal domain-containing protein, partial [Bacteroidota bacterium]|nr:glycoside hydrolase family 3 N-terminal domain-containing protein [Bacteroidota bacterium]